MSVRSSTKSPNGWETRKVEGAYEGIGKSAASKTNKAFNKACENEGVDPTARQYAKWANRKNRWKRG